jgi:hypothetical protein
MISHVGTLRSAVVMGAGKFKVLHHICPAEDSADLNSEYVRYKDVPTAVTQLTSLTSLGTKATHLQTGLRYEPVFQIRYDLQLQKVSSPYYVLETSEDTVVSVTLQEEDSLRPQIELGVIILTPLVSLLSLMYVYMDQLICYITLGVGEVSSSGKELVVPLQQQICHHRCQEGGHLFDHARVWGM